MGCGGGGRVQAARPRNTQYTTAPNNRVNQTNLVLFCFFVVVVFLERKKERKKKKQIKKNTTGTADCAPIADSFGLVDDNFA